MDIGKATSTRLVHNLSLLAFGVFLGFSGRIPPLRYLIAVTALLALARIKVPIVRTYLLLALSLTGFLISYFFIPYYFSWVASKNDAPPEIQHGFAGYEVLLGGDEIVFSVESRKLRGTVCFYLDDYTVVAAHSAGVQPGPMEWVLTRENGDRATGYGSIVADTVGGVVLNGVTVPQRRDVYVIADPRTIVKGSVAEIVSAEQGRIAVTVYGFVSRKNHWYLAFGAHDPRVSIPKGMSGSPIVQDGKVLAFLSAAHSRWHRPPQSGLGTLATDVYYHATTER